MASSDGGAKKIRVFLADDDSIRKPLKATFEKAAEWQVAGEAKDVESCVGTMLKAEADVFIVSAAWLGLMSAAERRSMRAADPLAVVIALGEGDDYEELRSARRLGADECLAASTRPAAVAELAEGLWRDAAAKKKKVAAAAYFSAEEGVDQASVDCLSQGKKSGLCVVTGLDGGTGKSFIALQIAAILAVHAGIRVCLIDLDGITCGLSRVLGGGEPIERTIEDLANVAVELTANHFERAVARRAEGFDFLAAGVSEKADIGSCGSWRTKVVKTAVSQYDAVIVDAPASIPDSLDITADDDALVYITSTPDACSAACARAAASLVAGVDMKLIINRSDAPGALSRTEMERLSGLDAAATVSDDAGAGLLFERQGTSPASRTNLAVIRDLIPAAQRVYDFTELKKTHSPSIKAFRWIP